MDMVDRHQWRQDIYFPLFKDLLIRSRMQMRKVPLFPSDRRPTAGVPHRDDLVLQVGAVDDAIVTATKNWLREGEAVPYEAMQTDLVAPSDQRSNLVSWLCRAASKKNSRTVLFLWKQVPSKWCNNTSQDVGMGGETAQSR